MANANPTISEWNIKDINILSINIQGLRNNKKLKSVLRSINQEKIDIALIQETYLTDNDIPILEKLWPGVFHLAQGSTRSKGLLTLFTKKFKNDDIQMFFKSERIMVSKIKTSDAGFVYITNIYGPFYNSEKCTFLGDLSKKIKHIMEQADFVSIVCAGDFNIVKDNNLDIISGDNHNTVTVEKFNEFANELGITDSWRIMHSNEKLHSWRRGSIVRRLDYIFIDDNLLPFIQYTDIKNIGFSDHSACIICMKFSSFKRGSSYYKMNTDLFNDLDYVNMIKKQIPSILIENENLNPHLKWEMLKVEVKELSQQYSRHKRCLVKNGIIYDLENLNKLEKEFVSSPTDLRLNKSICELKKKIEIRRMEDTRAAQIRSGVKWRENAEKCTRFFLSLEKSRAEDNTIHKVYSKDNELIYNEKEILNEIGAFYQNL